MNFRERIADALSFGEYSRMREDAQQSNMASQQAERSATHFREALYELEARINEGGWQLLSDAGERADFSNQSLRAIRRLALLMWLKNPIIRRGVNVQAFYVFGQGVTVHSKNADAKRVLNEFWNDTRNRIELTDPKSLQEKEREQQLAGETFFVFFTNRVTGRVRVGTLDPDEVEEVVCNPDDAREPWFYKRTWTTTETDIESGTRTTRTQTAYYPDWNYNPSKRPATLGGHAVRWGEDVYHIKTGGTSRMQRGVSEVYSQIDWARAYSEFLENRATVAKALARFVHKARATTKKGVQAITKRLSSTLGNPGAETNPSPAAGSTAVMGEGRDIEAMNVRGATIDPDEGRRLLLMVCSGKGLPETFYGDASVGTLATAESLDWPTALMMIERQMFWATVFRNIAVYVLIKAHRAALNPFQGRVTYNDGTPEITDASGAPITVDVDFPEVVKHNVKDRMTAISIGAKFIPSEREQCRLAYLALGEDDIGAKLDEMFDEQGNAKPQFKPILPPTPPPQT